MGREERVERRERMKGGEKVEINNTNSFTELFLFLQI